MLNACTPDPARRNVLVAHQFVAGAAVCESEEPSVGGVDSIDVSLFEGFDYVALGHIHKPEIISETMAYAGALEPIDRLDMGSRGYIYGEITDRGTRIQFCPASRREYRELVLESDTDMTSGEMEQWLEQQIHIEGAEHLYNVVLKGYRDMDIVYDLDRLAHVGNVVSVKDETLPWFDFERLYNENSENLIGMFIKKVYQMPMDEHRREQILSYGLQAMYHGRGGNER